jgi:FkbM family methyltransferase
MITIDEHTFDERLITDGWIIDAGCRGFKFHYNFRPLGKHKYMGIDIEDLCHSSGVKFKQAALTKHSGQTEAYFFGNGTGNFIKGINGVPENSEARPCETKTVPCITLQDIYNDIGTDIDLLKLDIEGAEYEILENIEPIPKQISVEMHQHCHLEKHNMYIERVLEHMCKHYHMNLYIREWPRYLFMDCLFIRKDLL